MQPSQGQIRFGGEPVHRLATHQVAQRGICLVPEHRGIFKLLTVEENLLLGQRKRSPWQLADIYRIFPRLKERRGNGGGQLSGGEQQMLARSEEHTSELQSQSNLVCRLLLEKKKT